MEWNELLDEIHDDKRYLNIAIINRIRFCEAHINDDELYMRIGCLNELEFYIGLNKKYEMGIGFNKYTIESVEKHLEEKKKIGL